MAVSKEEILDAISNMTVMEVVDLISMMEEKFGVSAAAFAAAPAAVAGGDAAAQGEERTGWWIPYPEHRCGGKREASVHACQWHEKLP